MIDTFLTALIRILFGVALILTLPLVLVAALSCY